MEGSILSTLAEWNMGDDWADDEHPVQLSTPEHYSEAQRRVVEGPMFDLLRMLIFFKVLFAPLLSCFPFGLLGCWAAGLLGSFRGVCVLPS